APVATSATSPAASTPRGGRRPSAATEEQRERACVERDERDRRRGGARPHRALAFLAADLRAGRSAAALRAAGQSREPSLRRGRPAARGIPRAAAADAAPRGRARGQQELPGPD